MTLINLNQAMLIQMYTRTLNIHKKQILPNKSTNYEVDFLPL